MPNEMRLGGSVSLIRTFIEGATLVQEKFCTVYTYTYTHIYIYNIYMYICTAR